MNWVWFPGARKIATLGMELTSTNMFWKWESLRIGCSPVEEKMKTAAIDQNKAAGKQMSKPIKIQTSSFPSAPKHAIILKTAHLVFGINFTGSDYSPQFKDSRQISVVCKQRDRIYLQKQTWSWWGHDISVNPKCTRMKIFTWATFYFHDLRLM